MKYDQRLVNQTPTCLNLNERPKIVPEVTLWKQNKSRQNPNTGVKINTAEGPVLGSTELLYM